MARQSPDALRRAQKIRLATDAGAASEGTSSMHHPSLRRRLFASLAAAALMGPLALPGAARAAPQDQVHAVEFNIQAGPLDAALTAFANQSGRQLIYSQIVVEGLRSAGLKGRYTPDEAIAKLVADAPIEIHRGGPTGFVLKRRPTPVSFNEPMATLSQAPLEPVAPEPTQLDEVVVTGSLIRGAGQGPSPILAFDRSQIDQRGYGTLADALSALPQNFGGMDTPATVLVGSDRSGTNDSMATGINLRGLGSSATLVLLNGRRMAGTGLKGNFADVSAIPVGAVERVEVLLDGASALYGSDAVGGVVNVILRSDFKGAETRARASIAAGGEARETQLAQTFGTAWSGGRAVVSAEYYQRAPLSAAARGFTASNDLRPLGGTDHRLPYAHPGNILDWNPATRSFEPQYAIPKGQDGRNLAPSDFIAGGVNLGEPRQGSDSLPRQERGSLYASLRQDVGAYEFTADALYSHRRYAYRTANASTILSVTPANPFFVSPNGQPYALIGYSFTDEIGVDRTAGVAESLGLNAGVARNFGRTWRIEAYGAYARDDNHSRETNILNSLFLDEALGNEPDLASTPFSASRDGYFNPYGATHTNSATVLDFISSGWIESQRRNTVRSANVKVDGELFSLPAGPVKIAAGVQVRKEAFTSQVTSLVSRATPRVGGGEPFERTIKAAFAELRVPLVDPDQAIAGVRRLELSLAGRIEDYSDAGSTRKPKVGVVWEPAEGVKVRSSYGESFRAPTLADMHELQSVGVTFLQDANTQSLILLNGGGNPDLKPETAKTWTTGVDFTPRAWNGGRLSVTYFDTSFSNQVGHPVNDDLSNALTDPAYSRFVRRLDPANAADVAAAQALIDASTSSEPKLFPASAYAAIIDGRYLNAGDLDVRGVDIDGAWGTTMGADRLDLAGNVSYLIDYKRRLTPTSPVIDYVNTVGMPVDLRANLNATWTHGAIMAGATLRYVDDYKIRSGGRVGSWTTADLQLAWTAAAASGALQGLRAQVTVQNLLDTKPPFYDAVQGVGYDPANADPLGRVLAVQLTKRW